MSKNISHIGKDGEAYFKHTGTYNEVKRPRRKYYYAVVNRETGLPLVNKFTKKLFLYTVKQEAVYEASRWPSMIAKPIPADSLHKLILLHTKQKS